MEVTNQQYYHLKKMLQNNLGKVHQKKTHFIIFVRLVLMLEETDRLLHLSQQTTTAIIWEFSKGVNIDDDGGTLWLIQNQSDKNHVCLSGSFLLSFSYNYDLV